MEQDDAEPLGLVACSAGAAPSSQSLDALLAMSEDEEEEEEEQESRVESRRARNREAARRMRQRQREQMSLLQASGGPGGGWVGSRQHAGTASGALLWRQAPSLGQRAKM